MPLTHVLGDIPTTRIIDFMLGHIAYDCSPKEIAEYADVAPSAVKRDIARLVECGVVVETRKIGGVQLYILNDASEITDALINLDEVISGDAPDPDYPDPGFLDMEEVPEDTTKYPETQEEWVT